MIGNFSKERSLEREYVNCVQFVIDEIFEDAEGQLNEFADIVKRRIHVLKIIDFRSKRVLEGKTEYPEGYKKTKKFLQNNLCREYVDYVQTGDSKILNVFSSPDVDPERGRVRLDSNKAHEITLEVAIQKFKFPFVARFFEKKENDWDYFHAAIVLGPGEINNYETFTKDRKNPGLLWRFSDNAKIADKILFEPITQ